MYYTEIIALQHINQCCYRSGNGRKGEFKTPTPDVVTASPSLSSKSITTLVQFLALSTSSCADPIKSRISNGLVWHRLPVKQRHPRAAQAQCHI